jgi:hypothetical protein
VSVFEAMCQNPISSAETGIMIIFVLRVSLRITDYLFLWELKASISMKALILRALGPVEHS